MPNVNLVQAIRLFHDNVLTAAAIHRTEKQNVDYWQVKNQYMGSGKHEKNYGTHENPKSG